MKRLHRVCRALIVVTTMACAIPAMAATLRWAAQNDILTLDPHAQNHATTNAILAHAYEGLTRYNEKYEVEPALATKWTYLSPTQVRFDLRKGVKFHDGTALTADDVVFSLTRIKQPQGTMQIYVTGINEAKKIDDHTVDLILSAPNPILLRNIIDFRIVSKAWAEKNKAVNTQDYKAKEDNYAARNVMGTGPYKITSWMPDQKVTMSINKDWWDKHTGNVDEVVYTPIKSDPTRVAALLSGDVDMLTDLPTQDVARLRGESSKLKILDGGEVRTIFFALDMHSDELKQASVKGKNPFKDKRVREALSIAIDREAIKRNTMRGLSIPAGILVAPGVNGHNTEIDTVAKPDPERAKKLLAEAGYPERLRVPAQLPEQPLRQRRRNLPDRDRHVGTHRREGKAGLRRHGHLHPEGAELRNLGLPAGLGRRHLRRAVQPAVTGAHTHHRRRRQLQLRPSVRSRDRQTHRRHEDRDRHPQAQHHDPRRPDPHPRRSAGDPPAPPDAPLGDEAGVTTVHRSDDRPEVRFTSVK